MPGDTDDNLYISTIICCDVDCIYNIYVHINISILYTEYHNTTPVSLQVSDSILLHLSPTTKGLRFIDPEKPLPPAPCPAQAALSSSTIQALINFLLKRAGQINTINYHSFHCQANSNHRPKVNHNCTDSICAQLLFQFRILYLDHI